MNTKKRAAHGAACFVLMLARIAYHQTIGFFPSFVFLCGGISLTAADLTTGGFRSATGLTVGAVTGRIVGWATGAIARGGGAVRTLTDGGVKVRMPVAGIAGVCGAIGRCGLACGGSSTVRLDDGTSGLCDDAACAGVGETPAIAIGAAKATAVNAMPAVAATISRRRFTIMAMVRIPIQLANKLPSPALRGQPRQHQ